MKNKLCADIAQIIYELSECGVSPNMRQVMYSEDTLPFHIMTHPERERAVLIGLMKDVDDSVHVKSFGINFNKWNWASLEGFDLDEIFKSNLWQEVFIDMKPHQVSSYLLKR